MSDQNFVELRWIYAVILRWWWLIAGLGLLAGIIAMIVISIMPPVYESTALLLVNPSKTSNASQYNDLLAGTQLALTYSQMVTDRPVLEMVISKLGLKQSADSLAKHITAEPVRNSQIIKLTVTDSNPAQAALIANTLAQAFTTRVEELSAQRYAGSIQDEKDRADGLQTQMKDLEAQIDLLRSQKIAKDVALADQRNLLAVLQTDYRSFQNSYQNLQASVSGETGKVYIVDPVQVQTTSKATSTATTVVSIGQGQPSSGNNPVDDRLGLTYGKLIVNPSLLQGVIKELGLTETTDQLSGKISYEVVPGTQLIQFKVQDENGGRAQLIAQSLVNAFIAQVKVMLAEPYSDRLDSMQKQIKDQEGSINNAQAEIGQLTSEDAQMAADLDRLETDLSSVRIDYRDSVQKLGEIQLTAKETSDAVIVTESAKASKTPSGNRMVYVLFAVFLGLVLGVGSAFLINYIKGQIRTSQDVRSTLNMPVLSTIGLLTKNSDDLVMESAPTSIVAEDFRVLGNKIRLICENEAVRTLMITSPDPSEGKSIIVSNLAISLTRMGMRVVVVDADLRLPRIHTIFDLAQVEGLTNSLCKRNLDGILQSTRIGELKILTSGDVPSNPAEVLTTPYLENLLQELKEKADLVLIDCPPILTASDASILATVVDGVLLVLRAGFTESGAARDAVEALRQVKAHLVGIVLNSVPSRKRNYYHYH